MGLLIDGRWHDQGYDTSSSGGRFVRQESVFRSWVTPDGKPGPTTCKRDPTRVPATLSPPADFNQLFAVKHFPVKVGRTLTALAASTPPPCIPGQDPRCTP